MLLSLDIKISMTNILVLTVKYCSCIHFTVHSKLGKWNNKSMTFECK